MDFKKLNIDHGLFNRLQEQSPEWWNNLTSDEEIYIDIRKENYINVYFNGGSIMKLKGAREYNAEIHFEFIPLNKEKEYLPFKFDGDQVNTPRVEPITLNNFDKESSIPSPKMRNKIMRNEGQRPK